VGFSDDVREIVARIPSGSVATYGQVAALAGRPRAARQVGYVMGRLPMDSDIPWQRVVNREGRISPRGSGGEDEQAHILLSEGVHVEDGRVDLAVYLWRPREGRCCHGVLLE